MIEEATRRERRRFGLGMFVTIAVVALGLGTITVAISDGRHVCVNFLRSSSTTAGVNMNCSVQPQVAT